MPWKTWHVLRPYKCWNEQVVSFTENRAGTGEVIWARNTKQTFKNVYRKSITMIVFICSTYFLERVAFVLYWSKLNAVESVNFPDSDKACGMKVRTVSCKNLTLSLVNRIWKENWSLLGKFWSWHNLLFPLFPKWSQVLFEYEQQQCVIKLCCLRIDARS